MYLQGKDAISLLFELGMKVENEQKALFLVSQFLSRPDIYNIDTKLFSKYNIALVQPNNTIQTTVQVEEKNDNSLNNSSYIQHLNVLPSHHQDEHNLINNEIETYNKSNKEEIPKDDYKYSGLNDSWSFDDGMLDLHQETMNDISINSQFNDANCLNYPTTQTYTDLDSISRTQITNTSTTNNTPNINDVNTDILNNNTTSYSQNNEEFSNLYSDPPDYHYDYGFDYYEEPSNLSFPLHSNSSTIHNLSNNDINPFLDDNEDCSSHTNKDTVRESCTTQTLTNCDTTHLQTNNTNSVAYTIRDGTRKRSRCENNEHEDNGDNGKLRKTLKPNEQHREKLPDKSHEKENHQFDTISTSKESALSISSQNNLPKSIVVRSNSLYRRNNTSTFHRVIESRSENYHIDDNSLTNANYNNNSECIDSNCVKPRDQSSSSQNNQHTEKHIEKHIEKSQPLQKRNSLYRKNKSNTSFKTTNTHTDSAIPLHSDDSYSYTSQIQYQNNNSHLSSVKNSTIHDNNQSTQILEFNNQIDSLINIEFSDYHNLDHFPGSDLHSELQLTQVLTQTDDVSLVNADNTLLVNNNTLSSQEDSIINQENHRQFNRCDINTNNTNNHFSYFDNNRSTTHNTTLSTNSVTFDTTVNNTIIDAAMSMSLKDRIAARLDPTLKPHTHLQPQSHTSVLSLQSNINSHTSQNPSHPSQKNNYLSKNKTSVKNKQIDREVPNNLTTSLSTHLPKPNLFKPVYISPHHPSLLNTSSTRPDLALPHLHACTHCAITNLCFSPYSHSLRTAMRSHAPLVSTFVCKIFREGLGDHTGFNTWSASVDEAIYKQEKMKNSQKSLSGKNTYFSLTQSIQFDNNNFSQINNLNCDSYMNDNFSQLTNSLSHNPTPNDLDSLCLLPLPTSFWTLWNQAYFTPSAMKTLHTHTAKTIDSITEMLRLFLCGTILHKSESIQLPSNSQSTEISERQYKTFKRREKMLLNMRELLLRPYIDSQLTHFVLTAVKEIDSLSLKSSYHHLLLEAVNLAHPKTHMYQVFSSYSLSSSVERYSEYLHVSNQPNSLKKNISNLPKKMSSFMIFPHTQSNPLDLSAKQTYQEGFNLNKTLSNNIVAVYSRYLMSISRWLEVIRTKQTGVTNVSVMNWAENEGVTVVGNG